MPLRRYKYRVGARSWRGAEIHSRRASESSRAQSRRNRNALLSPALCLVCGLISIFLIMDDYSKYVGLMGADDDVMWWWSVLPILGFAVFVPMSLGSALIRATCVVFCSLFLIVSAISQFDACDISVPNPQFALRAQIYMLSLFRACVSFFGILGLLMSAIMAMDFKGKEPRRLQ
jgi:hypothetical protein